MEQKEIKKLLKKIKDVCPQEYKVEIKQTKRPAVRLVIIKEPAKTIDLHDWSIFTAFPLHSVKISHLFEKPGDFRTLYCCGNMFVFFSPCNGVFRKFTEMIEYDAYGGEFNQHYVGRCTDIDKLVAFITETPRLIF